MKPVPMVLLLALVAAPALADELEGAILAYDRVANVIVMNDRSVVPLETFEGELPEDLVAGDRVAIVYQSDEDAGISAVQSVERID